MLLPIISDNAGEDLLAELLEELEALERLLRLGEVALLRLLVHVRPVYIYIYIYI